MILYPHSTPIILTDDIFQDYGGNVGNSTLVQRRASYLIAEKAATEDLGTYLLPTIVTGSYNYAPRIILDNTWIRRVILARFLNAKEEIYHTVTGTANYEIDIYSDERGVIDVDCWVNSCGCVHGNMGYPDKIQIVYEAGFPTGTANQADILLGLTTYASIILNEIIGYGNEAPGDVGVKSYSNQDYQESRVALLRTAYGTSARANFAHKLLEKYREHQRVGLGH